MTSRKLNSGLLIRQSLRINYLCLKSMKIICNIVQILSRVKPAASLSGTLSGLKAPTSVEKPGVCELEDYIANRDFTGAMTLLKVFQPHFYGCCLQITMSRVYIVARYDGCDECSKSQTSNWKLRNRPICMQRLRRTISRTCGLSYAKDCQHHRTFLTIKRSKHF